MSDKKENQKAEEVKENEKDKKSKEIQKDAEVLKLLEEDEDDFEEFEEDGTSIYIQHTTKIPPKELTQSNGVKIGTTRTSTTIS